MGMEMEGLKRAVTFLTLKGVNIGKMITDRHMQIRKWIRETMPEVLHMFDVWHVAKGENNGGIFC